MKGEWVSDKWVKGERVSERWCERWALPIGITDWLRQRWRGHTPKEWARYLSYYGMQPQQQQQQTEGKIMIVSNEKWMNKFVLL